MPQKKLCKKCGEKHLPPTGRPVPVETETDTDVEEWNGGVNGKKAVKELDSNVSSGGSGVGVVSPQTKPARKLTSKPRS